MRVQSKHQLENFHSISGSTITVRVDQVVRVVCSDRIWIVGDDKLVMVTLNSTSIMKEVCSE